MTKRTTTVGLMTVGCKLNQYETEGVAELLEQGGFAVVPFEDVADVYVVNTCTVTGRSDYRSRQMLRRAARKNPGALVVATGCYAEREGETLAAMPEVDLVVGNSRKKELASLVAAGMASSGRAGEAATVVHRAPVGREDFEPFDIERFRGYTRAFVKIQDGCDRRCSYCAVPDARGPSRSRDFDDVVRQTRLLAGNGYREVVLTGVHIGAYHDASGRRLSDLLIALAGIEELSRIRLGSVEPGELTDELARVLLETDKVCRHLHVPLESGSDSVLERMGRGYTREDFGTAVRKVTDSSSLWGLGTDVMVAFPGETEEEFADTVELIERLPFTYLHVFSFSPRSGTPAADMDDVVPPSEAKRRSRTLRELGARRSLAFRRGLVGERLEVLVEERTHGEGGTLSGLADNYVRIEVPGDDSLANRFVSARVVDADEVATRGEIIEGSER